MACCTEEPELLRCTLLHGRVFTVTRVLDLGPGVPGGFAAPFWTAKLEAAAGSLPPDPKAPFPKDKDGAPVLPPGIPNLLGFRENGNVRYVARMQPVNGGLLANLEQLAGRKGLRSFRLDGLDKILRGVTSVEEVLQAS